jgi:tetratricopeptide (TPR) repeat protein
MQLVELLEQGHSLRQHDRASVIPYFEKWIAEVNEQSDPIALVTALTELALALIEIGQPEGVNRTKLLMQQAGSYLKSQSTSRSKSDSKNYGIQKAYLLYAQGLWELKHHNFDRSLTSFQAAYQLYEVNADLGGQALADDALGLYYMTIGEFQTALMHLERALGYRQELDNEHGKAISFGNLGRFHLQIDQLEPVEDLFQTSLEIAVAEQDELLQILALSGLAQNLIAHGQWQIAISKVQSALKLTQEPLDTLRIAELSLHLAEAFLGAEQMDDSLRTIDREVMPRFRDLQNKAGIAAGKRIKGRIFYQRLILGFDSLEEDTIERAEDFLLDAAMLFEQEKMPIDYAKTLYDLAYLYQLCLNSRFKYQYQGKSVRSLELALNALQNFNSGDSRLAHQIDAMLLQTMGGSL